MNEKIVLKNLIFYALAGSKAYGTSTPESDTDYRGICILPDKSYYIGMGVNSFEQKDKWENGADTVVYDLRKALSLMADANPNMLDLLFTPDDCVVEETTDWGPIHLARNHFLSKRVRYTYGGYAFAQLKRIRTHRNYILNPPKHKPTRDEFGLPEQTVSKDNMGAFVWLIARLLEGSIENMDLSDSAKEELSKLNFIGLSQSKKLDVDCAHAVQKITGAPNSYVDVVMREKSYGAALSAWNSYQNWKTTRNPKRQMLEEKFQYDTKHAMHLVRLMRMGMEILTNGTVNVARPDAEELLEIRNGSWHFGKLEAYAEWCDSKLGELYNKSTLPKEPDRKLIDDLCISIIERRLFYEQKQKT